MTQFLRAATDLCKELTKLVRVARLELEREVRE